MIPDSYKRQDLFRFIRNLLYVDCMHPYHLDRRFPPFLSWLGGFVELLLELFLLFSVAHIWVLYICTFYLNSDKGDLEYLVSCLAQAIIYGWALVMKIYFRRLKPEKLEDLIEFINSNYETRSAKGFTYVTMHEALNLSIKWNKIFSFSCYGGVIFWCLVPFGYGDRSLPMGCWYPFDYKQPIFYEILYFLQVVAQIEVAGAFTCSSGLHMVLAILLSGQYDLLFCSLKNIFATVAINRNATKSELRELYQLQEFTAPEINEYYCAIEVTSDIDTLVRHKTTMRTPDFRYQFRIDFKKCVNHHRFIVESLNKMENFYKSIWFFKVGEVMILICLVAFVSVKSTTANSSFMKALSLYQYLFLVVWEMLVICYFGEIVYLNSQRCGDAILRSPLYLYMHEIRHDLLFFLLNAKKPFKLTAGKMFVLNVERFKNIITSAFSFLTLLQKMDQHE